MKYILLLACAIGCGDDSTAIDAGPDAALLPGVRLRGGEGFTIQAITSDDYVIYSDPSSMWWAQSVGGGSAIPLVITGSDPHIRADGTVAFIWHGASPQRLGVWSAAAGYHHVSDFSATWVGASSRDGAHILFSDHVVGNTVDLVGANIDLSQSSTLVSRVDSYGCGVGLAFLSPSTAITAYCPAAGSPARLDLWNVANWTATNLRSDLSQPVWWSTNAAGTRVFTSLATGPGVVIEIGGNSTLIDTDVKRGVLTSNGDSAIYQNSTDLRRASVSAPAPTTLAINEVMNFWAIAPDESKVLFFGATNDLHLASAIAPGPSTLLGPVVTLSGDQFTADSSLALYFVFSAQTGEVSSLSAAGLGGAPRIIAGQGRNPRALSGTTIVYWDFHGGSSILGDLKRVDVKQTPLSAELLVSDVDPLTFLTSARDQIVYTSNVDPATAGLYVLALP